MTRGNDLYQTVRGLFIVALVAAAPSGAQTTQPTSDTLPAAIEKLQNEIQKMRPIQVRAAIKARFGEPTREIGSGIIIPQWDVAGGTLTFSAGQGPTFVTRAGAVHWLMRTKNPAGQTILTQYEMTTLPDPANHGTQFWIGDVYVAGDRTYRFKDGGSNLKDRGDQSGNFFINHPAGRADVEWSRGINDDTLLESAGDGVIAHLTFHAANHPATLRCTLSSATSRSLELASEDKDGRFRLGGSWRTFWPVPPANPSEIEKLISGPP